MPNAIPQDITHEQVAFDFLSKEFVELAGAFMRLNPKAAALALSESERRLVLQFEGLGRCFERVGLGKEFSDLVSPAEALSLRVIEDARTRHPALLEARHKRTEGQPP